VEHDIDVCIFLGTLKGGIWYEVFLNLTRLNWLNDGVFVWTFRFELLLQKGEVLHSKLSVFRCLHPLNAFDISSFLIYLNLGYWAPSTSNDVLYNFTIWCFNFWNGSPNILILTNLF
jgi:hypothetical protein